MNVVAFELGISLGEITKARFEETTIPKLDDAFTWFVQSKSDIVTIHALHAGDVRSIGRARWRAGKLVDRDGVTAGLPNEYQWKMVATALGRVQRRAFVGTDGRPKPWARVLASIDPKAQPILVRALIAGVLCIGVVVAFIVLRHNHAAPRTSSSVADVLARYPRLVWPDVADRAETTVPLVLKDADRERGKKLCVTGMLTDIERVEVDRRTVHTGGLRTTAGDDVQFIALGSSGALVRRSPASLCGIATGKAGKAATVVGLFDLPENRDLER